MSTRLHSIRWVASSEYEVSLQDDDGALRTMICRVVGQQGIRVVQPRPDLMSNLAFSPRLLTAAILAFDSARTSG